MPEQIVDTIETNASTVSDSGQNVLNTIIKAIGLDIDALSPSKIIGSVILLIILIAISKILSGILKKALRKSKLTEGLKKFIANAAKYILYFISILIFCDSIGIPITSMLAIFSLLGLAVSLSIQNLLGNVMSGISLLMLKPFDIGDYIETDIAGTVKNIGLFYTEIVTLDNKRVYIPNETIMGSKLINYHSDDTRRIDITVNAAYDCDISAVKAALSDAVAAVPTILNDKPAVIGIADYGESAILYDIRAWTKTEDYLSSKYALMEAVADSYAKHGVKMAYNRLEVELIK